MTTSDVPRLLQELTDVLRMGGEPRWAASVADLEADVRAEGYLSAEGARAVLRLFGGSGTLGDVVLQPGGKVDFAGNERLDALRTQLYQAAMQAIEAKN